MYAMLDLLRLAFAAFLIGCLPGWFWSKVLYPGGSTVFGLVYAGALSAALVPAVTLAAVRGAGTGVTLPVVVLSVTVVFVAGLVAYLGFGAAKGSVGLLDPPLSQPPVLRPTTGILVPLIFSTALMLAVLSGLMPISWAAPLLALALFYAVVSLRTDFGPNAGHCRTDAREKWGGRLGPAAHRVALGVVLALVLFRGYVGPAVHDWPFIRGVDQYNHAVMANEMLSDGWIFPYLIYPPGFHTMTANVSLLSGIEPLQVFPILAPVILLLPTLSLYTLARRLWGPDYGLAAAGFAGLVLVGPYQYFSDAMYPNMFTSQFLLILTIAGLIELYARPSARTGLLFVLLGSSVVLYHQVASLYLALLLVPVAAYSLYRLYRRNLPGNVVVPVSLLAMGLFSALYAWDTYNPPDLATSLLDGPEQDAGTGNAVSMTIGSQPPFSPLDLVGGILTQPVSWLGLFGAFWLLSVPAPGGPAEDYGPTRKLAGPVKFIVLAWVAVFLIGSVNPLTGFPQRFARGLGMPLALLSALVLVSILGVLASSAGRFRPASRLALFLGAGLLVAVIGVQVATNLSGSTGTRTPLTFTNGLTVTPEIAAAGEWLRENNAGGNIMVSPQGNQVPSRMMLAMGDYSAMQSYPADSIRWNRDLPPAGSDAMWDVLYVMEHPAGEHARSLLREYNVRYLALYKYLPDREVVPYWRSFLEHPGLYRVVFENEHVVIVEPVWNRATFSAGNRF